MKASGFSVETGSLGEKKTLFFVGRCGADAARFGGTARLLNFMCYMFVKL